MYAEVKIVYGSKKIINMENNFNVVEQYIKGELKGKDLDKFMQRLSSDTSLQEDVALYENAATVFEQFESFERKEANQALVTQVAKKLETDSFFDNLDLTNTKLNEEELKFVTDSLNSNQELTQEKTKVVQLKPKRRLRVLSLAASFLVLVVTGSLIFSNTSYSNQQIAIDSYKDPGLTANMKGSDTQVSPLETGTNAYYRNNYKEAIESFSTVPNDSDYYLEAQYNLAHTHYQLKEYDKTIDLFQYVIANSQDARLIEASEWYLALSYLASNNKGDSFQQLMDKMIMNENHRYHFAAKEMNTYLNSLWRKFTF